MIWENHSGDFNNLLVNKMVDEELERARRTGQELDKIVNSIYRFEKLAENSISNNGVDARFKSVQHLWK